MFFLEKGLLGELLLFIYFVLLMGFFFFMGVFFGFLKYFRFGILVMGL